MGSSSSPHVYIHLPLNFNAWVQYEVRQRFR